VWLEIYALGNVLSTVIFLTTFTQFCLETWSP
jgi:hypothetical protein